MQAKTQKAWKITEKGLDKLQLIKDSPIQPLEPHDIQVRVIAAALNPVDYKRCEAIFDMCGAGFVGLDAVGVVADKGAEVSGEFVVGETVVAMHGNLRRHATLGTYAEYTIQDSRYCCVVPASLIQKYGDLPKLCTEFATLITTGYTAYQTVYNKLKLFVMVACYEPFSRARCCSPSRGTS